MPCLCFKQKKIISALNSIRKFKTFEIRNVFDGLIGQKCRKVRITERTLPTGPKNLFEVWRLSNYRDSNYGKLNIRVS